MSGDSKDNAAGESDGSQSPARLSTNLATPAARALHNNFRVSVAALQRGLVRSVYYLSTIHERKVHRALGYASIADYAADVVGFSRNQTESFLALGRRLADYPEVRRALDSGELSWSKARLIVERARPEDEQRWVEAAGQLAVTRLAEALRRRESPRLEVGEDLFGPPAKPGAGTGPPGLPEPPQPAPSPTGSSPTGSATPKSAPPKSAPAKSAPALSNAAKEADEKCHLTYALTPDEYSLWSAAHETLRRQGRRESSAELLVVALGALADPGAASGGARPRYLLQIHHCPKCEAAELRNHRGRFAAPPALLAAAQCDAVVEDEQIRRRAFIAPRTRRRVLNRDGHACQGPGCGTASFLEIHHRVPVAAGGRSELENPVTLCARCHRALHERERELRELAR